MTKSNEENQPINADKLAKEIMDSIYSYFDGYYVSDGGEENVKNQIASVITNHLNQLKTK